MKKMIFASVFMGLLLSSHSVEAQSVESNGLTIARISSGPSTIPRNAVRVPFMEFRVKADRDIVIKDLTFQQKGLSSFTEVEDLSVQSRYGKSTSRNVDNDGVVIVTFRDDYKIRKGAAHVMTLFGNMSGKSAASIGFDLVDITTEDRDFESEIQESQAVQENAKRSYRPEWASRQQGLIPRQRTTRTVSNDTVYEPKTNYSRNRRFSGSYRPFRGTYRPYSYEE